MSQYVTWGGLAWVIAILAVADVLSHIGTDLVKLYIQRRKTRVR